MCAACETYKPGCEPAKSDEKAAAPAFGAAGFNAGAATGTTFSFGSSATGGSTFSFASSGTGGFTFGSQASTGAVTFGSVTANNGGVTFGSSGPTQFETASKFGVSGDQTKDEFKDKKAEKSGDEDDKVLYKITAKVYVLKTVEEKAGEEAKDEVISLANRLIPFFT